MLDKCECWSVYKPNVDGWTGGQRAKTNPKISPEQSGELKSVFHRSEPFSNLSEKSIKPM
ncbi:hypothetical protein DPMN_025344 [Dreissena polymorpha]|uniref:Uncharacterized protein n=1 Tax=Dreissena polymorpha TaxID=45954 RepID=A0A9D4RCG9_DREPO|nr:hypothetical protein DPMN_025344 [Dreissena polymorpha]